MSELLIVNASHWHGASLAPAPGNVQVAAPLPWEGATNGKCYRNVQSMIARHGGEAVYGWALTDFGPHHGFGGSEPPLYRRWLNHVVWRDPQGPLWEVTPHMALDEPGKLEFLATEFLIDPEATFKVISDDDWDTQPTRYVPVRPEGVLVADLLTQAQHAKGDQARNYWLRESLCAIQAAGFRPREWKVETIGERTGSIWLIAE